MRSNIGAEIALHSYTVYSRSEALRILSANIQTDQTIGLSNGLDEGPTLRPTLYRTFHDVG